MNQTKSASATDESATTAELLDRLLGVVGDLSVEVKRLRSAVDALRWECENDIRSVFDDQSRRPVTHITSMPKDPCAADFGERINQRKPNDLPSRNETAESPSTTAQQDELW